MSDPLIIFIFVFYFLGILISIIFLSLFERKFLSYIQLRKGPNRVGVLGLFQPLRDALKLFSKEYIILMGVNFKIYVMGPLILFLRCMLCWLVYPLLYSLFFLELGILFFIRVTRLRVYYLLMRGWLSNSRYSLLGRYRGIVQSISYEIILFLLFLIFSFIVFSYNFLYLMNFQYLYVYLLIYIFIFFLITYVAFMAELNRSPMDLIEGESELVSGFNLEYIGGAFSLIFIGEYGIIVLRIMILRIVFFGYFELFIGFILVFRVIWIRGTFPRLRYDFIIKVFWKIFLPLIFLGFYYFFSMVFFL